MAHIGADPDTIDELAELVKHIGTIFQGAADLFATHGPGIVANLQETGHNSDASQYQHWLQSCIEQFSQMPAILAGQSQYLRDTAQRYRLAEQLLTQAATD